MGEVAAVAGVAALGVFGIVALAGAIFGGGSKENKNKQ